MEKNTHICWNEIKPGNMPTIEGYIKTTFQILLIDEKHNIGEGIYLVYSNQLIHDYSWKPTHWSYLNYP